VSGRAAVLLTALLLAACGGGEPAPAPDAEEPAATPTPAVDPAPSPSPPPSPSPSPTPAPIATDAAVPGDPIVPTIDALPDPAGIADSPAGLDNGAWAPELALRDLMHDTDYRLSDHVGPTATGPAKVAVVGFAASWCGRCKASYPYLAQLKEEMGDDLHIVLVTLDESEPLMKKEVELVRADGLDVPVLRPDEHTARAWLGRKRNIPHFYIINRAGEVLVQDRGFGDKVKKVLPGQLRYAMNHPDYVVRRR
jgi:thiol-disulfide isomerase/thioredoxin